LSPAAACPGRWARRYPATSGGIARGIGADANRALAAASTFCERCRSICVILDSISINQFPFLPADVPLFAGYRNSVAAT
jgi:hypothetical protein